MEPAAEAIDVKKHLSQIQKIAYSYWRCLPPSERHVYDVEDMIGLGQLVFHRCTTKWKPNDKASFNTYLYHSLHNRFRDLLAYSARKNTAQLSQFSVCQIETGAREGEPSQSRRETAAFLDVCKSDYSMSAKASRQLHAEDALTSLLLHGNPEDVKLVEMFILSREVPALTQDVLAYIVPKLQRVFAEYGVTYEDLKCLRHATA